MKIKDLKINFRYLGGNIACLSVDSISGESVHNDINNEEAIIIFNSLVGEKADCQTVKSLLKENQELKKQVEEYENEPLTNKISRIDCVLSKIYSQNKTQQKEFIKYLEDEIERKRKNATCMFEYNNTVLPLKEVLQKYEEIIGVSDESKKIKRNIE